VIVGPNPCIDRRVRLGHFEPGHVHRAQGVEEVIGGGGVNAARVAAGLGADVRLVTAIPARDEESVVARLRGEGLELSWVRGGGQIRVATILREGAGRTSIVNEPGSVLDSRAWEGISRLALRGLGQARLLVCSGSLPPGAPTDGYARLARQARHLGSSCIVDAAGEALAAVLDAGEGLVVPNLAEAEAILFGPRPEPVHPEDAPERARGAATELLKKGAHRVVITAGSAGAAFAEQGAHTRTGWVDAKAVQVIDPVGAGDAFSAGLAVQIEGGAALGEAVEFAVSVASSYLAESGRRSRPAPVECDPVGR